MRLCRISWNATPAQGRPRRSQVQRSQPSASTCGSPPGFSVPHGLNRRSPAQIRQSPAHRPIEEGEVLAIDGKDQDGIVAIGCCVTARAPKVTAWPGPVLLSLRADVPVANLCRGQPGTMINPRGLKGPSPIRRSLRLPEMRSRQSNGSRPAASHVRACDTLEEIACQYPRSDDRGGEDLKQVVGTGSVKTLVKHADPTRTASSSRDRRVGWPRHSATSPMIPDATYAVITTP